MQLCSNYVQLTLPSGSFLDSDECDVAPVMSDFRREIDIKYNLLGY
jgi:hypothetical protein